MIDGPGVMGSTGGAWRDPLATQLGLQTLIALVSLCDGYGLSRILDYLRKESASKTTTRSR